MGPPLLRSSLKSSSSTASLVADNWSPAPQPPLKVGGSVEVWPMWLCSTWGVRMAEPKLRPQHYLLWPPHNKGQKNGRGAISWRAPALLLLDTLSSCTLHAYLPLHGCRLMPCCLPPPASILRSLALSQFIAYQRAGTRTKTQGALHLLTQTAPIVQQQLCTQHR